MILSRFIFLSTLVTFFPMISYGGGEETRTGTPIAHPRRLVRSPTLAVRSHSSAFAQGLASTTGIFGLQKAADQTIGAIRNGLTSKGRQITRDQLAAQADQEKAHELAYARQQALKASSDSVDKGDIHKASQQLYHAVKAHQALRPAADQAIETLKNSAPSQLEKASYEVNAFKEASTRYPDLVAAAARIGGGKPSVYSKWVQENGPKRDASLAATHAAGRATGTAIKGAAIASATAGLAVATGGIGIAGVVGLSLGGTTTSLHTANEIRAGVKTSQTHTDGRLSPVQKQEQIEGIKQTRERAATTIDLVSAPAGILMGGAGVAEGIAGMTSATSLGELAAHTASATSSVYDVSGATDSVTRSGLSKPTPRPFSPASR